MYNSLPGAQFLSIIGCGATPPHMCYSVHAKSHYDKQQHPANG